MAKKSTRRGTRTAAQIREDKERRAREAQARQEAADPGIGGDEGGEGAGDGEEDLEEEVDNDRLPVNHPTIMDKRDVAAGKLPPEATPREGKTSIAPPLAGRAGEPFGPRARERSAQRTITVEATQLGYYDNIRRRPGDVFKIRGTQVTQDDIDAIKDRNDGKLPRGLKIKVGDPAEFSSRWMRKASQGAIERTTGPNQAIARQHDAILGGMGHTAGGPVSGGLDQAEEPDPIHD